eukprot:snap_masked-scaffold_3-processed-gene-10.13-mRNA-1 protein AED:1.00 eAED:1.00 QI:0/-1/0/0/-1/1/1/0/70
MKRLKGSGLILYRKKFKDREIKNSNGDKISKELPIMRTSRITFFDRASNIYAYLGKKHASMYIKYDLKPL